MQAIQHNGLVFCSGVIPLDPETRTIVAGGIGAQSERVFGSHKPARSTVEVARLPMDVLVEIECIAVAG